MILPKKTKFKFKKKTWKKKYSFNKTLKNKKNTHKNRKNINENKITINKNIFFKKGGSAPELYQCGENIYQSKFSEKKYINVNQTKSSEGSIKKLDINKYDIPDYNVGDCINLPDGIILKCTKLFLSIDEIPSATFIRIEKCDNGKKIISKGEDTPTPVKPIETIPEIQTNDPVEIEEKEGDPINLYENLDQFISKLFDFIYSFGTLSIVDTDIFNKILKIKSGGASSDIIDCFMNAYILNNFIKTGDTLSINSLTKGLESTFFKNDQYKDFIGVNYEQVFKKKRQDIGEETYEKIVNVFFTESIDKIMVSFNNFNDEINNIELKNLNCDGKIVTPDIYDAKNQIELYEGNIEMFTQDGIPTFNEFKTGKDNFVSKADRFKDILFLPIYYVDGSTEKKQYRLNDEDSKKKFIDDYSKNCIDIVFDLNREIDLLNEYLKLKSKGKISFDIKKIFEILEKILDHGGEESKAELIKINAELERGLEGGAGVQSKNYITKDIFFNADYKDDNIHITKTETEGERIERIEKYKEKMKIMRSDYEEGSFIQFKKGKKTLFTLECISVKMENNNPKAIFRRVKEASNPIIITLEPEPVPPQPKKKAPTQEIPPPPAPPPPAPPPPPPPPPPTAQNQENNFKTGNSAFISIQFENGNEKTYPFDFISKKIYENIQLILKELIFSKQKITISGKEITIDEKILDNDYIKMDGITELEIFNQKIKNLNILLEKLLEKSEESKITNTNPKEIKTKEEELEKFIMDYTSSSQGNYHFSLRINSTVVSEAGTQEETLILKTLQNVKDLLTSNNGFDVNVYCINLTEDAISNYVDLTIDSKFKDNTLFIYSDSFISDEELSEDLEKTLKQQKSGSKNIMGIKNFIQAGNAKISNFTDLKLTDQKDPGMTYGKYYENVEQDIKTKIEENNFTKLVYLGNEHNKLTVSQAENILYNDNFNNKIIYIFKSNKIYNKSKKINKIELKFENKDNPFV